MKFLPFIVILFLFISFENSFAQCPGADNDGTYGSGSWIGYVYSGSDNFTSGNYQGRITESQDFNTSFCSGADCTFSTNSCTLTANNFSVRFRMNQTFSNGVYRITIGGDDGVRLSLDGGSTYIISDYGYHAYQTSFTDVILNGSYNMVLDYFEGTGESQVSFQIQYLGINSGGLVGSDQNICGTSTTDPVAFTSLTPSLFSGGGTIVYRWQSSTDNTNWSNITGGGANGTTYDIPAGFTPGTLYYRRRARVGGTTVYSNTLTVDFQESAGDQTTYGNESWIGYLYDGVNNFSTNYMGEVLESEIFDEQFGGDDVWSNTSGCDFQTQTFSVRFKMTKIFAHGEYEFTIGGDDGVRLSVDGGSSWIVDDYTNHGYQTATSSAIELNGAVNLVLEYYEDGGGNRVTFDYSLLTYLPVKYTYIKLEQTIGCNQIQWETATEINNDYFEVQRTADGHDWIPIGRVNGSGNSKDEIAYEFCDDKVIPQIVLYYRLKQVDFDGVFEYSETLRVGSDEASRPRAVLSPNPASDIVQIDWPGNLLKEVHFYNMAGVIIKSSTNAAISLKGFVPGYYLVKVVTLDGQATTERLIVR